MRFRRAALFASLSAFGLWLAQPALRRARTSLATYSAPGVGVYEAAAGQFMGGLYRDIAADAVNALGEVAEPSILEVGPGPGHLAERLLAALPGAHWMGLDVDGAMLEAAERRLERAGTRDRATLVEADVAAMPFPDDTFDLVVSSLSAHHWPDPERGFAEIRRVLRPGGVALVYDLPKSWGHLETGHRGIRAADAAFTPSEAVRVRGVGPITLVERVLLRA